MGATDSEIGPTATPGADGAQTPQADRGHRKRAGIFFTPAPVARHLAERAVAWLDPGQRVAGPRVCDPFVGEGVLLRAAAAALLPALHEGRPVGPLLHGADLERAHLATAGEALRADELGDGLSGPHLVVADTLLTAPSHWPGELGRVIAEGGFDVVITNPPWEKLRVNDREFFARWLPGLGSLTRAERDAVRGKLLQRVDVAAEYAAYRARIAALGTAARRDYATTGSGGDLDAYKLAVERCVAALQPGGVAALIVPHGVLGDWGARRLRAWLLEEHTLLEVIRLETGRELFPEIHANLGVVLLFIRRGRGPAAMPLTVSGTVRTAKKLERPPATVILPDWLRTATPAGMVPLVESPLDLDLLDHCQRFPMLGEWPEERFRPRREVDMTLDRTRFCDVGGGIPLLEGKNLQPFRLGLEPRRWDYRAPGPPASGRLLVRGPLVRGPGSAELPRVAWRAVADRAMRRRLVAAWVPPGVALGNSLIASSAVTAEDGIRDLLWLLAWLNSRIAEAQLRLWSANNNINVHHLRVLRAPLRDQRALDSRIVSLAAGLTGRLAPGWPVPAEVAALAPTRLDAARAIAEMDALWRERYGSSEHLWTRTVLARTAPVDVG